MAYYAALASLTNLLHDIIYQDRYPNYLLGKRSLIISLHQNFNFLEESLQGYSSTCDEAADHVEGRIRELAQRVLDIIETGISYQYQIDLGETFTPCDCMFCRHELDLAELKQEVDSIVEDLTAIKDSHGNKNLQSEDYSCNVGPSEQTTASLNIMVGLDEHLNKIKEQLCGSSSQLQVISIVGMGGIGKTTLAKKTFDDSLVSYHFYCRAWTTISQEYDAKRVYRSIQKSLSSVFGDLPGHDDDPLDERIYKSLKGQRYLIVIDDVWSTEVLSDMLRMFPDDSNGSRILLTTRLLDVARYASTSSFIHHIPILNSDESWNLLREKVFGRENCPSELECVGKFIASKCGGLPLAIVAIAGILSNRRTPQNWEKVASNVASILNGDDEQLSNILSLSYNHLSHQLKSCFLFMGCFHEDYSIPIPRLVRMWIAEGFLKSSNGFKTLEQVAEECLLDLVKKNLAIFSGRRLSGQSLYCMMHDLVREFCTKRAFKEQFFHGKDWESLLSGQECEDVRRIIPHSSTCEPPKAFRTMLKQSGACDKYKLVRSVVGIAKHCTIDLKRFKLLRLLDMPYPDYVRTTFGFSQLFLLKYLFLPSDAVKNHEDCFIPLFKLPNLETLHIYDELALTLSLPSEFWRMPRLKYLNVTPIKLPPILEVGGSSVQNLKYLQTLRVVKNFVFINEAIERIFNVRHLAIRGQGEGNIDLWNKYCLNNLARLQQLEVLVINLVQHMPSSNKCVLPLNLKDLHLVGCRLSWKELTVAGSLPCLQLLLLENDAVVGEEWEPTEGEFLHLKLLYLKGLDLQHWLADNTHFPCLEHLELFRCNKLKEIPPGIGDIPALKCIVVHNCQYARESARRILEEQQCQGNDALQVHVV